MKPLELKEAIKSALAGLDWFVTVDEQYMMNVTADDIARFAGFVYIEELNSSATSFARFGMVETDRHDVYFCRFVELDATAEERERVRDREIMPAVRMVEKWLNANNDITDFTIDKYPRGFDANEVLIHITFNSSDRVC